MKKKVKIKNVITEPAGTPAPKGNLWPFASEDSISRAGNPNGGNRETEKREKQGLGEEETRDEAALKNHVEQEQSLRGDVFCEYRFWCRAYFMKNELWFPWEAQRRKDSCTP